MRTGFHTYHSPHSGEIAGKKGSCQGRVRCAAKRSESLDASRFPAMLLRGRVQEPEAVDHLVVPEEKGEVAAQLGGVHGFETGKVHTR